MASTLDTWRGDESGATRLSVYLESWRHYKPVPICWSVFSLKMLSCAERCTDASHRARSMQVTNVQCDSTDWLLLFGCWCHY